MRIVIVGCGKVGTAIVSQLCAERHEITVIDIKSERVHKIDSKYDVMGIVGDGSSISILTENNLENTEVFIAVTGSDETNLLSCMFAKKTCGCHVIARVRKPVYYRELDFIRAKMGIDTIINPDHAAAVEISRILRFPAAQKIDTFAGGSVRLVKFELKKECELAGMALSSLSTRISPDVLICAVERDGNVIIPKGSFVFQAGDIITYLAQKAHSTDFLKRLGLPVNPVRSATLVGGSTICSYLTKDLLAHGIVTRIIEENPDKAAQLAETYPTAEVSIGDGTDRELLKSEDLLSSEAFVSLLNIDEENVFLSMFAKKHSDAKIVTKLNRLEFDDLLENVDFGIAVYPKNITCDSIVQTVRALKNEAGSRVKTFYRLLDNRVEALEFTVHDESAVTKETLAGLNLKNELLICCITRGSEVLIPRGNDRIRPGDSVVVVTKEKGLHDITDILD